MHLERLKKTLGSRRILLLMEKSGSPKVHPIFGSGPWMGRGRPDGKRSTKSSAAGVGMDSPSGTPQPVLPAPPHQARPGRTPRTPRPRLAHGLRRRREEELARPTVTLGACDIPTLGPETVTFPPPPALPCTHAHPNALLRAGGGSAGSSFRGLLRAPELGNVAGSGERCWEDSTPSIPFFFFGGGGPWAPGAAGNRAWPHWVVPGAQGWRGCMGPAPSGRSHGKRPGRSAGWVGGGWRRRGGGRGEHPGAWLRAGAPHSAHSRPARSRRHVVDPRAALTVRLGDGAHSAPWCAWPTDLRVSPRVS